MTKRKEGRKEEKGNREKRKEREKKKEGLLGFKECCFSLLLKPWWNKTRPLPTLPRITCKPHEPMVYGGDGCNTLFFREK
jgi:hypothetical protein